jgi:hypothetical protein
LVLLVLLPLKRIDRRKHHPVRMMVVRRGDNLTESTGLAGSQRITQEIP